MGSVGENMKAVIPAAGFGTRFLPATKAQPKEMLALIDKPIIQYVVEEAVQSGITDIIIITGPRKRAIQEHFDPSPELEEFLLEHGKTEQVENIRKISRMARITYVLQDRALGLGHAIQCARPHLQDGPFAVLFGDDVMVSNVPVTRQLIKCHHDRLASVLSVMQVPEEQVEQYGIIGGTAVDGRTYEISAMVEKPSPDQAPSRLAIDGRAILEPDIFDAIDNTEPGKGGEIQLTDAINRMRTRRKVYAYRHEGTRYDVGTPTGYVKATIDMALSREEFKHTLRNYLETINKAPRS